MTNYEAAQSFINTSAEVTAVIPDGFSATGFNQNPFVSNTSSYAREQLIQEKKAPENLVSLLSEKEKVGAIIFVIEKHSTTKSWFVKYRTNKFFLTGMNLNFREKVQVMETFGTSVVSFFDDAVKMYDFSGLAIEWPSQKRVGPSPGLIWDTESESYIYGIEAEDDEDQYTGEYSAVSTVESSAENFWQSSLIHMYTDVLRGTQLVRNDRIALMSVGTHFIYGYPVNMVTSYTAQSEKFASFNMSWVVLDHVLNFEDLEEKDFGDLYKFNESYTPIGTDSITKNIGTTLTNISKAYDAGANSIDTEITEIHSVMSTPTLSDTDKRIQRVRIQNLIDKSNPTDSQLKTLQEALLNLK